MPDARGQRLFLSYAPVQTDKTKESADEIRKELNGILKDHVITEAEMLRAKGSMTQTLAGRWETNDAVGASLNEIVQYGLAPDYYSTYSSNILGLKLADMNGAAVNVIHPESLVWVIVGDRAKIEEGVRSLNLGEFHIIDSDGNPVQ